MGSLSSYYFAYGSNLPYLRMLERTSSDLILKGKFTWEGRRLTFAKRSDDGSGKCTVIVSDRREVWGANYWLTPADKLKLAKYEVGYHEVSLMLPVDGAQRMGFTYIADEKHIDRSLRPNTWYQRLRGGGRQATQIPGGLHRGN